MFSLRVEEEHRLILLAAPVQSIRQVQEGTHLVVADNILAVRLKCHQLLDEDVHLLVRLIALHDPVAGPFGQRL